MHSFADNAGREWRLNVNVSTLTRVANDTGIRLDKLFESKLSGLEQLLSDPAKLVEVLWSLCETEAKRGEITPEQFGAGFAGDALESAANALIDEVILFFPSAPKRALATTIVEKARETDKYSLELAKKKVQELTPEQVLTLSRRVLNSPES